MAGGTAMVGTGAKAGRPRDAGRHAGDGPAGGAGASPAAVARLLALANGSGVEAVLGALAAGEAAAQRPTTDARDRRHGESGWRPGISAAGPAGVRPPERRMHFE